MINCFSFASFKLLLLFLTFYILIITCFGVGPLSSSQLELSGLPESVCLVLSPGLGNLSTIISYLIRIPTLFLMFFVIFTLCVLQLFSYHLS